MKKIILAGFAATVFAGAALAGAHGSMSDKRVAAMKEMGGAMKAISNVAKGNAAPSADTVAAAKKLNMLAQTTIELFPEGSMEYRAKASIWSDWAGFKAANERLIAASADLVAATETMDAGKIGAALGATGKTCGGCHDDYRGPKPS
ncbi:MAG: cytochrome c [Minwuia sp.]|nr:cytochrome c [Minwuia sp.]